MKWGKRRESLPSRFLFEMQDEPGDELPEEHVSAESAESSRPGMTALSPGRKATPSAPVPGPGRSADNEFDAPPF
jgi:hypothetical protein